MTTTTAAETEVALQRMVTIYVVTGLLFLVLPGTFLGVWNLVSISGRHSLAGLSQAWLQAHGHAQIFGWIGTFIIGIGYYSLSKMGGLKPVAVSRGWTSWALWTGGVSLRWVANVTEFHWRLLLPLSAALQLTAFLIFFATVSRHKSQPAPAKRSPIETWMKLVIASTCAFLLALLVNQVETMVLASTGAHPEIPHWLDQRYLFLAAWGFPVLAVWGFNARWLPVFSRHSRTVQRRTAGGAGGLGGRHHCGALGAFPNCDTTSAPRQHSCGRRLTYFWAPTEAREDAWGLPVVSGLRSRRLRLASHCSRPRRVRGPSRYTRRHLGRFAPCAHGRVPCHHGVRNRPESPARVLRNAPAL